MKIYLKPSKGKNKVRSLNIVVNVFSLTILLVLVHPEVKNWIKYAKFEEKNSYISSARRVYERAVEFFGEDNIDERLVVAFAKFEEGQKEVSTSI